MSKQIYDALIVGGGPAGLSAAVYLGRFLRRTAVIDGGGGRSAGPQVNENYLGFPRGISAARLRRLGRRQTERFGVEFIEGHAHVANPAEGGFTIDGDCGRQHTRALIIATGVADIWPSFPGVARYVGRSLFWCITCDGFRTRGKRAVLIGATPDSVTTACQFLRYTDHLTFIATGIEDSLQIEAEGLETLREHDIAVVEGAIERVHGVRGVVHAVKAGGQTIEADIMFSLLGHLPNSGLAAHLGVLLDPSGYIRIDKDQRTNVPGVYAAGDVTGPYAHQVSSAVHEGAMAAQTANYDLYEDFQRD